jgi:hypothetical protein
MELLMVLLFTVAYIVLALIFVFIVRRITKIKLYRWLAVAFVLLLPTWDVLLGFVVYRIAVIAGVPSEVIYETAQTDGIYYEGMNNTLSQIEDKPCFIGGFQHSFKNHFKYAEAEVTEQYSGHGEYKKIKPVLYRCETLPTKEQNLNYFPMNCFSIEKPKSQYGVIISDFKLGIAGISTKKIINLSSRKLLAQYRVVSSDGYLGMLLWNNGPLPFFNWLDWWENTAPGLCVPDCGRYYSFEYKVLKPKE